MEERLAVYRGSRFADLFALAPESVTTAAGSDSD
jgi:hypothetical protein